MPRRTVDGGRVGPPSGLPMADAMALLPADERQILFCAASLHWSVDRIADVVDLPSEVVKLRLHDALRRLLGHAPRHPPGTP
ncbi:hypothetical protein [Mycobacterium sp. NPDC006124]|uniref:hypothetical protein n=1 Tax=Mycobacterium sp. NPDC006124 TaxID=3156729 RepID=UPI0033A81395